jgi:hypothetical protein
MEFRLIYEGPLKANGRVEEKHLIRKAFHKQLSELWKVQRPLIEIAYTLPESQERPFLKKFAARYARCGFQFLPLVNKPFNLVCALDILFLRRESSGELVRHGGDLDNRMKTLFDALRMPESCDEVGRFSPDEDENPFYCLLEDDAMITDFHVTTDRLLAPLTSGQHPNEVYLIIKVRTQLIGTEGFYSTDFAAL